MATITISCPHTSKIYPSCSSPKFFHTLKITYTYQKFESLYYLHGDDQIIDTPYIIPVTDLVESDSINPFCNECQRGFLEFFHNKCYSPFNKLENLRMEIRKQMARLVNDNDTCACNCTGHGVVYSFEYILKRPITDEELALALELARLDEAGLVPASERAIEAVETLDVEDLEETVREASCCICLEGLVNNEDEDEDEGNNTCNSDDVVIMRLARLPCQHMFHDECILKWLHTCHLCPICRFELAMDESDIESYFVSDDDDEEEEDTFLDARFDDDNNDEEIFMNAFDH